MSLISLPQEVLEILFLYVGVEDLLSLLEIVGLEGSDSFWRKICQREGYKRTPKEDACWRNVFHRNINWRTCNYVKREYRFKNECEAHSVSEFMTSRVHNRILLMHGKNIIIKSGEDEISIWNLDECPVLIKKIPAAHYIGSWTKLLVHNPPEAKIYSNQNNSYCEIFKFNLSTDAYIHCTLTDEYFAAFYLDSSQTSIQVMYLESGEEYILPVSSRKVKSFNITILDHVLNVVVLEQSTYALRRYDLIKKEWLDDLALFSGAVLIGQPKLEIGSDLIVSWSNYLEVYGVTPIKVWSFDGQLLKSISVEFARSFGDHVQSRLAPEMIMWLVVDGEYVIFSTFMKSFTIWTCKEPDVCRELAKSPHYYTGQSVIPNWLLVLCYTYCFKVVDFKKTVYLYEVTFEQYSPLFPLPLNCKYFANEYFYVYLEEYVDGLDREGKIIKTGGVSCSSACSLGEASSELLTQTNMLSKSNNRANTLSLKDTNTFVTVYDFTFEKR